MPCFSITHTASDQERILVYNGRYSWSNPYDLGLVNKSSFSYRKQSCQTTLSSNPSGMLFLYKCFIFNAKAVYFRWQTKHPRVPCGQMFSIIAKWPRYLIWKRWVTTFTFTFMHLADAFIQSDLHCIQAIIFFYQYVCSLGIEPTTFCAANAMLYHWATGTPSDKRARVCEHTLYHI